MNVTHAHSEDLAKIRADALRHMNPYDRGLASQMPVKPKGWRGVVAGRSDDEGWRPHRGAEVVTRSYYTPNHLAVEHLRNGQLMPHQVAALVWERHMKPGQGRVLADAVGAGKTVTTFAKIDIVLTANPEANILILAPANLVDQWVAELAKFLPNVTVRNLAKPRRKNRVTDPRIWVASHESSHKIGRNNWDLVVVDELAQIGKIAVTGKAPNYGYSKMKGLTAIANVMPANGLILGLSATLSENDPAETWGYLNAIKAERLPPWETWRDYLDIGNVGAPVVNGVTEDGGDQIRKALGTNLAVGHPSQVVMVRGPERLGLDLPRRADPRQIFIPLLPEQQQAYDDVTPGGLEGHKQREKISRSYKGQSALLDAVVAELLKRQTWEKAIVYAENLAVLDMAERELDQAGISHCRIDGTNADKRQEVIASHKDPEGPRVLLGSKVLERGLNLHYCNVMLSMDPTYNPASEMQREGRICRIGSTDYWYQHIVYLPDVSHVRRKVDTLQRRHSLAVSLGLAEA